MEDNLLPETEQSAEPEAEMPAEDAVPAETAGAAEADGTDETAEDVTGTGSDTDNEGPAPEETPEPESAQFPEEPVKGTLYSDPFFNIPPVLGAMDGLDRETFWSEVAAAKPRRRRPSAALMILAVLMLVLMTFIFLTAINGRGWLVRLINGGKNIDFTLPTAEKPKLDSTMYQEDGRYTVEGISEAVSPSVVSLEIYEKKSSLLPNSQGSGIIMTEDGYIVTNAHVVDDAAKIKVILNTKEEFSASLVGSDEASDIAVIKISAANLQPAEYGDSDQVALGEDVVCIGSPAGFYGSVTKGIVSGLNRLIKVESFATPMRCIQVDAAINPGNSGGALLNMWGQVIGITSSKLSSTKYDGIGFAISINAARPIIESLISIGYMEDRPRIGISYYFISQESAESVGAKPGMLIASVDDKCDIANTDLKVGDLIVAIDGVDLITADDVKDVLENKRPGDTVTSHVMRPDEEGTSFTEFDITYKLEKDEGSFVPTDSKAEGQ
ncbi:MAG: trypsin-like peptidase domain-containing protein [Ruminococcus sp.]|nr:trypsin-like peptidase domain-containing protein [Ruminococcus sp.]